MQNQTRNLVIVALVALQQLGGFPPNYPFESLGRGVSLGTRPLLAIQMTVL
jgi:hypothetical protein